MFTFTRPRSHADHSSTRQPQRRRPLVEDLEGRRLLSAFTATPDVQKVREAALVANNLDGSQLLNTAKATPAIIAILHTGEDESVPHAGPQGPSRVS